MVIQESSINRIMNFINAFDIACITAFRGKFQYATKHTFDDRPKELQDEDESNGITEPIDKTPYQYTMQEKKKRNSRLKATLLKMGYGVTSIKGNYIENYHTEDEFETGEDSFFVVNLNNDANFYQNIFELSEYYNQDCFLYKPKNDENAYNIGTNMSEYPGYNQKDNVGKFHINIDNEFLSRIGNKSFAFTNNEYPTQDKRNYNFQTRKQQRMRKENRDAYPLNLTLYEDYERGGRMTINSIYENYIKNLNNMANTDSKFTISEGRMRQITSAAIREALEDYAEGANQDILQMVHSMRSNILDLSEDGYGVLYVDYDPRTNELFAGYASNAGISKNFTIQYDGDYTLDQNLEALVDEIYNTPASER